MLREFEIIQNGVTSSTVELSHAELTDVNRFAAALTGSGPFVWLGSAADLRQLLLSLVCAEINIGHTERLLLSGYYRPRNLWLLDDGTIDSEGRWASAGTSQGATFHSVPLDTIAARGVVLGRKSADEAFIRHVLGLLRQSVGIPGWIAAGWFAALPYIPDIEDALSPPQFPLLHREGGSQPGIFCFGYSFGMPARGRVQQLRRRPPREVTNFECTAPPEFRVMVMAAYTAMTPTWNWVATWKKSSHFD